MADSNSSIFKDPKKSRIIWHDAKKYPSIFKLFLENIQGKVYGDFPDSLKQPLSDLKLLTIENIIYLDVISMLSKIEMNLLTPKKEQIEIAPEIEASKSMLKPLIELKKIKIEHVSFSIFSDSLLIKFLLKTLLYVLLKTQPDNQIITLSSENKSSINITGKAAEGNKINLPDFLLEASKNLEIEDSNWQPVTTHIYTCQQAVKTLDGDISIAKEDENVIIIKIINI